MCFSLITLIRHLQQTYCVYFLQWMLPPSVFVANWLTFLAHLPPNKAVITVCASLGSERLPKKQVLKCKIRYSALITGGCVSSLQKKKSLITLRCERLSYREIGQKNKIIKRIFKVPLSTEAHSLKSHLETGNIFDRIRSVKCDEKSKKALVLHEAYCYRFKVQCLHNVLHIDSIQPKILSYYIQCSKHWTNSRLFLN